MLNTFYDCVKEMDSNVSKYICNDGIIRGNFQNGCVFIYYIFVNFRNQGIFRTFLHQLLNDKLINRICILGVQSQILDDYLSRFEMDGLKFHSQGGDFTFVKNIKN